MNLTTTQTMTSREIAELAGKEHKNVMRDIRKLLAELDRLNIEPVNYTDAKGETRPQYVLDKDLTLTLISGYRADLRYKIVKRWHELEKRKAEPKEVVAVDDATKSLSSWLTAAKLLGVPEHLGQAEAVKQTKALTGVDFRPLLQFSPGQDDVEEEDMMLEPNELAKLHGFLYSTGTPDGASVNNILYHHGYQDKVNGRWEPTEKGKPHCALHHWTAEFGTKSGYNYKWSNSLFKSLLEDNIPF